MKNKLFTVLFASLLPLTVQACTDHNTQAAASAPTAPTASAPHIAGIWLDVRTAEEFHAGHLKDALNVPHEDIASRIATIAPDKSQPINLYCQSGRRAEAARQTLLNMGYTHVINHGGHDDLRQRGFQ